ncbi:tyrosinase cofactor [Streptomyces sp. SKN60]|uniref:apotyrosinase chaperone MelC1 n=1 Tax=Streptomyces sp. SKN60 TaxID=2855506 RepID=UPI00224826F7|nr:tyrosinase family oxidase copper chaperone [Streptomyces sp. SKN60]MCX2179561.1 tyrosinase cofactor [Streptomyces sp. SKN60]
MSSSITRRKVLGVAAGAAGAAAGLALAGPAAAAAAPARTAAPGSADFDEVYLGRHIKGGPSAHGGHHGGHEGHGGGYTVTIDGAELHVMRNADGTWISVITHYDPVATPRAAARAAVRELQGAPLVPLTLPVA